MLELSGWLMLWKDAGLLGPAPTQLSDLELQQVLVRRGGDESFSMVSWLMSQHDERWLIDSLNIV